MLKSHTKENYIVLMLPKKYSLNDPALDQLTVIVRSADTARINLTPQSAGLYA